VVFKPQDGYKQLQIIPHVPACGCGMWVERMLGKEKTEILNVILGYGKGA
jgi:hypothetical protein